MQRMRNLLLMMIMVFVIAAGCSENNTKSGGDDDEMIADANNALGFSLLDKLDAAEGNTFISPTSLYVALAMVYQGADGETKAEMDRVLGLDGLDIETVNRATAALMADLAKKGNGIQLDIANALWYRDDFKLLPKFKKNIENFFAANLGKVNMENSSQAVEQMNDWVEQATNGKITQMVDGPLPADFAMMVLNAVYFNGKWTFPFDPIDTRDDYFYGAGGKTGRIPFMQNTGDFSYFENKVLQAIRLPYGTKENLSMYVFLPKENTEMILADEWKNVPAEMVKKQGTVFLPKFTLEYESDLNHVLSELGMQTAFNKELAEFPHMITGGPNPFISKIKQKTFLDVHEEGTEAAGVTSIEFGVTSLPIDEPFIMDVNRPFYLMIVDETTNIILFAGHMKEL